MKTSLKNRITNWLKKKEVWVASGEIQRLAQENGYWSPQNSGRRLRELVVEGRLEVEYRKGHAWYRYKSDYSSYKPNWKTTANRSIKRYNKENNQQVALFT